MHSFAVCNVQVATIQKTVDWAASRRFLQDVSNVRFREAALHKRLVGQRPVGAVLIGASRA